MRLACESPAAHAGSSPYFQLARLHPHEKVVNMIKKLATQFVFLVAILFLMSACASRDEVVTEQSSSQPVGTVPGEKVSGEGSLSPGAGPGGPNASVRW